MTANQTAYGKKNLEETQKTKTTGQFNSTKGGQRRPTTRYENENRR